MFAFVSFVPKMSPITTANLASTCVFPVIPVGLSSNGPATNFLYFERSLLLNVDVCGADEQLEVGTLQAKT